MRYELILTDPYERFEILSGTELRSLSDRYYIFRSEDGRYWLLSNYLIGFSTGDVHRGIRVSVHVARIPSLSTELLRRLERGGHEVTALVQEGKVEPYAIGDIRLVEQNE